jgi:hypothetical protein
MTKKAFKEKEKRNEAKKSQTELILPQIPKLSHSLVKALYKYLLKEECGLRIHASYIDRMDFPNTDAEDLDFYLKYKATGKLLKNGDYPKPILLKNGNPSIEFARLDIQAENFKQSIARLNFTIEQTGFEFTNPLYAGITDIIAHDNNIKSKDKNKKRIIIELRSSALINDKLSPNGWADENINEKWDLLFQAIHYKMLAKYEWGIEDIPFYFFVFSTKNEWEYKMFKINVDANTMQEQYLNLKNTKVYLDETLKTGFVAHPKFSVCRTCPLSITCNSALDMPQVQEVSI